DDVVARLPVASRRQLETGRYPAVEAIVRVAIDGARLPFEEATALETDAFVDVAVGQTAKNMIQSAFFDRRRVSGDRGAAPVEPVRRCVVLGAGMMGAGIAYVCAKAGIKVVLKDVSLEVAERGR